jgi:hypothetical protein
VNARSDRLRTELDEEEKRFNSLVAAGDHDAAETSVQRIHVLEQELQEANGGSLLGDGSRRL